MKVNENLREQIFKIYSLPRLEITKNLKKFLTENYSELTFLVHHAQKNTNGNYLWKENENTIIIQIDRKKRLSFKELKQTVTVDKLLESLNGVIKKKWEFHVRNNILGSSYKVNT